MAARLTDEVFDALDEQTVVVPGTGTLDVVIPSLARSLAAVHEQRRALEVQIEALLEEHPLPQVLISMPGIAVRTAAVLLVTFGDGTSFPHRRPPGLRRRTRQVLISPGGLATRSRYAMHHLGAPRPDAGP
jgi:transposase